jgi:hypothetical protein
MKLGKEVMLIKRTSLQYFLSLTTSTILTWLRFKFQIFGLDQEWSEIGNQGMYFTKGDEIILN